MMTKTITLPKVLASIITLALTIALSYPVLAQDATRVGTPKREQVKERVEVRKETIKERIATREAALKAKLQSFRDKQKAQRAEKINTTLTRINKNQTDQMLKHLSRMFVILNKLETRVTKGSPDVKDVNLAKGAIDDAKTAIASAEATVKAQSEKDYTIAVTSEADVRQDVKKVRDQLHTDLKNVRTQVINAKQAVANAIRVAKSGKLEIPAKEGTPSGQ